ncbi:MAG TPA: Ig-like domain-containing protein [Terracidiphilus sp.]|nr:Ig-like domain-containing protein [Terracidiphilus sp.]
MNCRPMRLDLVAGLGIALAMVALTGTPASAQSARSETTLTVRPGATPGQADATVTVTDENGTPAAGVVAIDDGDRQLGSVALNSSGKARATFDLPAGEHTLRAVYAGDATMQGSASQPQSATPMATGTTPDFQVTVTSLNPSSLTAGTAGTATVTVTPVNNAALTAPMFITLSCSGLPNQSACSFTPATLQIVSTTPTSCAAGSPASACPPSASVVIQTQGAGVGHTSMLTPAGPLGNSNGMLWAVLFPGMLGLGGLAWGTRRRRWLSRLLVLAAVGVVTMMGTTACNPQYHYYHNGIPANPATPSGNYTVTVTAQSSNGITGITHSTTLAMTVK